MTGASNEGVVRVKEEMLVLSRVTAPVSLMTMRGEVSSKGRGEEKEEEEEDASDREEAEEEIKSPKEEEEDCEG